MGYKGLSEVDPTHAQVQVADIDARLAAIKEETKDLQERRKALSAFVSKK